MTWTAFYTHDRVFESHSAVPGASTRWEDLPATGCLAVAVFYEAPYRESLSSGDWFYLDQGRVRQTACVVGSWAPKPTGPDGRPLPAELVKQGQLVSDAEWAPLLERVHALIA